MKKRTIFIVILIIATLAMVAWFIITDLTMPRYKDSPDGIYPTNEKSND